MYVNDKVTGAPIEVPETAEDLQADERFGDEMWHTRDGRSFYQVACDALGADRTARLWADAIRLDVAAHGGAR